jgi:hypothetical protein
LIQKEYSGSEGSQSLSKSERIGSFKETNKNDFLQEEKDKVHDIASVILQNKPRGDGFLTVTKDEPSYDSSSCKYSIRMG